MTQVHERAQSDGETPHVAHREELIYLLAEAAELEHGLMCSYLYAGFSLKRAPDGSSQDEKSAIERWRAAIRGVATEEMVHLALVQNLLAAIGAAPHMQRPNFPVAPGLYPSGVVLKLTGFDEETLDHFIYLERPEEAPVDDGSGFPQSNHYTRNPRPASITPSAQDYPTLGALYRGIEAGFEHLSRVLGEQQLFIGDPQGQVDRSLLDLDGVQAVTNLAGARRAIERIIEQGEGGRRSHTESHFDRFRRMRTELEALRRRRPDFAPAHPVVANPVMNAPADTEHCVHIDHPSTARVLDLACAVYALMVQLLACFFCGSGQGPLRRKLIDGAVLLMTAVIRPLAELLASLPASPSAPGKNAGFSFTLPRSIHALPRTPPALVVLQERANHLSSACAALAPELGPSLENMARQLKGLAQSLRDAP